MHPVKTRRGQQHQWTMYVAAWATSSPCTLLKGNFSHISVRASEGSKSRTGNRIVMPCRRARRHLAPVRAVDEADVGARGRRERHLAPVQAQAAQPAGNRALDA